MAVLGCSTVDAIGRCVAQTGAEQATSRVVAVKGSVAVIVESVGAGVACREHFTRIWVHTVSVIVAVVAATGDGRKIVAIYVGRIAIAAPLLARFVHGAGVAVVAVVAIGEIVGQANADAIAGVGLGARFNTVVPAGCSCFGEAHVLTLPCVVADVLRLAFRAPIAAGSVGCEMIREAGSRTIAGIGAGALEIEQVTAGLIRRFVGAPSLAVTTPGEAAQRRTVIFQVFANELRHTDPSAPVASVAGRTLIIVHATDASTLFFLTGQTRAGVSSRNAGTGSIADLEAVAERSVGTLDTVGCEAVVNASSIIVAVVIDAARDALIAAGRPFALIVGLTPSGAVTGIRGGTLRVLVAPTGRSGDSETMDASTRVSAGRHRARMTIIAILCGDALRFVDVTVVPIAVGLVNSVIVAVDRDIAIGVGVARSSASPQIFDAEPIALGDDESAAQRRRDGRSAMYQSHRASSNFHRVSNF